MPAALIPGINPFKFSQTGAHSHPPLMEFSGNQLFSQRIAVLQKPVSKSIAGHKRVILQNFFHRNDQFICPSLFCSFFYLGKGITVFQCTVSASGTDQFLHACTTSKHLSHIVTKCTDVRALTAGNLQTNKRQGKILYVYLIKMYRTWLSFHLLPFPGQFIKTFSVNL